MLREATKDLGRLRVITRIIGKYGYDQFLRRSADPELSTGLIPADKPVNGRPLERPPSVRATGPRAFRQMLEELGPTFIKLGQILSTRPDVIGVELAEELSKLQDNTPADFLSHHDRQVEKAIELLRGAAK